MNWDGRGDANDYLSLTNLPNPIREEEQRSRVCQRHLGRRVTTVECLVLMEVDGQVPLLAGGD